MSTELSLVSYTLLQLTALTEGKPYSLQLTKVNYELDSPVLSPILFPVVSALNKKNEVNISYLLQSTVMTDFNPFGRNYKGTTSWMNRKVMLYLGLGLILLIIYRYFLE